MPEKLQDQSLNLGPLVSSDSHVMESADFWVKNLPASLRAQAPQFGDSKQANPFQGHEGGRDPVMRINEMARDGVSGEVLYATRALTLYGLTDIPLQEACFRVYNDWLQEYCAVAPERLFGVACISAPRIEEAVREAQRCKNAGMRGIMVWIAPPKEYAFSTGHYDPLWEAAEALGLPVSLHILTGVPYTASIITRKRTPIEFMSLGIGEKLGFAIQTLTELVVSGVFDRFPKLKVVTVENEVSWMPFIIAQLDKYAGKKYRDDYAMKLKPSEYFQRNIYATFFNDPAVGQLVEKWGPDTWMWSNDFPHPNSTWPNSREVIARDMHHLPQALRSKLVRDNVARLYGLPNIAPLSN